MTVRRRRSGGSGDGSMGRSSSMLLVLLLSTFLIDWRSSLGRGVETRSFSVLRVRFQEIGIVEWVDPDRTRRASLRVDVEEVFGTLYR